MLLVLAGLEPAIADEQRQCQHGLSFFGDFKYPPGFSHFDYVNPDAPKGGRLARLGNKATVRLVETAQFLNLRRKNKNDAVFGSLAIAMPPNLGVPAYFGSTSHGIANFARISSPVVDHLSAKILSAGGGQSARRGTLTAPGSGCSKHDTRLFITKSVITKNGGVQEPEAVLGQAVGVRRG